MLRTDHGLTLEDLREQRDQIVRIAAKHGAHNVRVFGSVARGQARPDSDVDFLVDFDPDRTVLDLSGLILDLEKTLGRRVDVAELRAPSPLAAQVRREAVPLCGTGTAESDSPMAMSEAERERQRLRSIQEGIARIEEYTRADREVFLGEPIVQDAVLRRLETLADAASKLSDSLKARHAEVPWPQIYGFRNVAAHAYERLDLSRVWEVVELYLPILKAAVDEELGRGDSP